MRRGEGQKDNVIVHIVIFPSVLVFYISWGKKMAWCRADYMTKKK